MGGFYWKMKDPLEGLTIINVINLSFNYGNPIFTNNEDMELGEFTCFFISCSFMNMLFTKFPFVFASVL